MQQPGQGGNVSRSISTRARAPGRIMNHKKVKRGSTARNVYKFVAAVTASGRQFVVIAAGGHLALQSPFGDYIIAYALPKK